MEKRIIAVIKWLERSLKSCRDGQVENAMMDVECARADMERLRSEAWANLSREPVSKKSWRASLVCIVGLLFVLSLSEPLCPDAVRVAQSQNEDAQAAGKPEPSSAPQAPAKPKATQSNRTLKAPSAIGAKNEASEPEISFERVASLLQTGEKALKNGSPIIRIER